jgi:hypothetical protein
MKKVILLTLLILNITNLLAQEKKFYSNEKLVEILNEEVQKEINLVRQNPGRRKAGSYEI